MKKLILVSFFFAALPILADGADDFRNELVAKEFKNEVTRVKDGYTMWKETHPGKSISEYFLTSGVNNLRSSVMNLEKIADFREIPDEAPPSRSSNSKNSKKPSLTPQKSVLEKRLLISETAAHEVSDRLITEWKAQHPGEVATQLARKLKIKANNPTEVTALLLAIYSAEESLRQWLDTNEMDFEQDLPIRVEAQLNLLHSIAENSGLDPKVYLDKELDARLKQKMAQILKARNKNQPSSQSAPDRTHFPQQPGRPR